VPGEVWPAGIRSATVSQFETLVRASRLYYELGETQERIAGLLGVTRPQVSRLLKRARAEGIVEIRIVDSTTETSPAADELRARFRLHDVQLAPGIAGPEDLTRRIVGRLAAQVLRSVVRDGMVVGIGDGASVSATADAIADTASPVASTVVPLCGGYWFTGPTREPFRRIGEALGATVQGLLAPGLVDDAATRTSLYAHAGVRTILSLWERLDVALFGIGGPNWTEATLGRTAVAEIESRNAVGEVLIAPFDLEGRFVADALRERTIAFDARDLPRVPMTIGVAGGPSKVRPILGALRAGAVNTLITDVRTAEAVLALAGGSSE
jgi:deoxyribonucleoside regulator